MDTQTGGRIKRLAPWLGQGTFMLTWGDGVSDVDLRALLAFHHAHGKLATLTAVRPPTRYGHLEFEGNRICSFSEKPQAADGWINGAFFVLEEVLDLGRTPLADRLLTPEQLGELEPTYPLEVAFCPACGLLQIPV